MSRGVFRFHLFFLLLFRSYLFLLLLSELVGIELFYPNKRGSATLFELIGVEFFFRLSGLVGVEFFSNRITRI